MKSKEIGYKTKTNYVCEILCWMALITLISAYELTLVSMMTRIMDLNFYWYCWNLRLCSDICVANSRSMIFQVAKVTTSPLSVNTQIWSFLIYDDHNIHKVFKHIKQQTFNSEKWINFLLCVSQLSECITLLVQPD